MEKSNVKELPGSQLLLSDPGAEDSVLGALLNAEGHPLDCREEIIEIFTPAGGPKIFTQPANRKIYSAFMQCLVEGASTGPHGVTAILRREGDLSEEVMQRVYHLSGNAGGPVEAVNGARTLRDLHDTSFDLIVTLSPEAHHQALELTRTMAVDVEYWPTFDATLMIGQGNREQILQAYRDVRDSLFRRIKQRFGFEGGPSV